jgi:hypothetical protein
MQIHIDPWGFTARVWVVSVISMECASAMMLVTRARASGLWSISATKLLAPQPAASVSLRP